MSHYAIYFNLTQDVKLIHRGNYLEVRISQRKSDFEAKSSNQLGRQKRAQTPDGANLGDLKNDLTVVHFLWRSLHLQKVLTVCRDLRISVDWISGNGSGEGKRKL